MQEPLVHVLLATYNGQRHLAQQWASLEAQQGAAIVVHVGDDGSSDGTVELLRQLAAARAGAVREVLWMEAPPRRSASQNFLQLLAHALRARPDAQWFAFCDQDDTWLPGKLAAALQALAGAAPGQPALYGGRTLSVDEDDRELDPSPLFGRRPCFENALVQNIMGGNTIVMNRAAAAIVAAAAGRPLAAHDWFCYLAVTGAGGWVHYDPQPYVRYRQHAANVVGSNLGWRARGRRWARILRGDHRQWHQDNIAALAANAGALTPANRAVLERFAQARAARTPWSRAARLRASGAFRQSAGQQLTLWLACLLGRL